MLSLFQLTNCVDSNKSAELDKQYPQGSTEYFDYEIDVNIKSAPAKAISHDSKVVFDEKFSNFLGSRLERKKITEKIQGGKRITTTEKWFSKTPKTPSIFTWKNAAPILGILLAAAAVGVTVEYQLPQRFFDWFQPKSETVGVFKCCNMQLHQACYEECRQGGWGHGQDCCLTCRKYKPFQAARVDRVKDDFCVMCSDPLQPK